jgi:hypothetical protein
VITVVMSAAIESPRERVWRALIEPSELLAWDERLLGQIDFDLGFPREGSSARWRFRLGSVQTVLRETILQIVPQERLSASRAVGSLRLDQVFSLNDERGATLRTRLSMKIAAKNSVPVLGDTVDRFEVRRVATSYVNETLRALQKWCENHP